MNNEVKYTLSTLKPYKKALRFKGSRFSPAQVLEPGLFTCPYSLHATVLHPSSTYHLVTCPLPGTSAAGSAGSGCGWCGRSGSSSDGGRSRLHCSADSSWRSPAQEKGHGNTSRYWMDHCGWRINPRPHSLSVDRIHSRLIDLFYSSWWYFCFASARQIR